MDENWQLVKFKDVIEFSLLNSLSKKSVQAADTDVALWQGNGITVRIDYGLFVDPLTSYAKQTNYQLQTEEIDGVQANLVQFDQNNGSHVVAVSFPTLSNLKASGRNKLTVFIETEPNVEPSIPLRIARSIHFMKEKPNDRNKQ